MTIRMDETYNDRILLYTVQIRVSWHCSMVSCGHFFCFWSAWWKAAKSRMKSYCKKSRMSLWQQESTPSPTQTTKWNRSQFVQDIPGPYLWVSFFCQDVDRTRRDFEYFRKPGTKAALTAMLFVYAKLNPGVRYVQGPPWVISTRVFGIFNGFNI